MKVNQLEMKVIDRFLKDSTLPSLAKSQIDFDQVDVTDRDYTGAGFFTEFERSEALRIFEKGTSMRGGRVGARLNSDRRETGYVFYVDDGYLTTLEGYTYGDDEWPKEVTDIEIYEVELRK
ncbi:MAG TPA: hypothetical protein VK540_04715 [Polyangiaceae bacterium]|nr:hypothetical protein [Polyangiaceae bacterium]